MSDWEGIDGVRFKAVEMEGNPDLDVNVRTMATMISSLCGVLHDQGIDSLQNMEKMVIYLRHVSEQRLTMLRSLELLADEVRMVREQLVDRAAHLDAREAEIERREQQLHENAQKLIQNIDNGEAVWPSS